MMVRYDDEMMMMMMIITLTTMSTSNDRLEDHRRRNDFSVEGAKIGEKQSRQSNSKYNFVKYVFFEKGIYGVQWGRGMSETYVLGCAVDPDNRGRG